MTKKQEKDRDSDVVAKLRAEHERLAVVKVDGVEFVFKPLELEEFESAQARMIRARERAEPTGPINREMAQQTLLHPDLGTLQAAFRKYPALGPTVADALARIANAGIEADAKKD